MGIVSSSSPFTPIADYAFLSDCHTGALVAPDGSVDWLCVPRFDSPSIFGSLLDRGAGYFRFGPYGIDVPAARSYDPGTNVLVTTWHTPGGWLEVRDALTMRPRSGPDETTPHSRPPADDDAEHLLVRTATCLGGTVDVEVVCEPCFDYGRSPASWTVSDADGHTADGTGAESPSGCTPTSRSAPRAGPCAAVVPFRRATPCSARCRGRTCSTARPTRSTRPPASRPRATSGAAGSAMHASPTTPCARTSSARR